MTSVLISLRLLRFHSRTENYRRNCRSRCRTCGGDSVPQPCHVTSRDAADRIAQLGLQHIPLNSYLHRFGRTDKANCPACGDDEKDIAHFLLSCPKYAYERWALAKQVEKRRKNMTIETLLVDPELPLVNHIDNTNRFKTKPGEHTYI